MAEEKPENEANKKSSTLLVEQCQACRTKIAVIVGKGQDDNSTWTRIRCLSCGKEKTIRETFHVKPKETKS